jgi:regulation of enolase protein 1 (concanavalin A-like superfamily)
MEFRLIMEIRPTLAGSADTLPGMKLFEQAPEFGWRGMPGEASLAGGVLSITAGPGTDWFYDPSGSEPITSAPLLLAAATGPMALSAQVEVEASSMFDAGALYVHAGQSSWGKLALEQSPAGELMLVSVITTGRSDDCNHRVVGDGVFLRVSVLGGGAFAFHASDDGRRWDLLRYFSLPEGDQPLAVGFSAQSPTGEGCTASFGAFGWSDGVPQDLRDGS